MALLSGCADILGNHDVRTPGELMGVYTVTANIKDGSACTEIAATIPKPWKFEITLRRDGKVAYWMSGGDAISGTLDETGKLTFRAGRSVTLRLADKKLGVGACVVDRVDTFEATFDRVPQLRETTPPKTLKGGLRYQYSQTPGSDCRGLVVGSLMPTDPEDPFGIDTKPTTTKTMFSALPCSIELDVEASSSK